MCWQLYQVLVSPIYFYVCLLHIRFIRKATYSPMLVHSALNVPSVVPMSFIPHCSLFSWDKDLEFNSGLLKITSITLDHVIKIFVTVILNIISAKRIQRHPVSKMQSQYTSFRYYSFGINMFQQLLDIASRMFQEQMSISTRVVNAPLLGLTSFLEYVFWLESVQAGYK